MELKIYFNMLQRNWWVILLTALIGLTASLVISYLAVPRYQAGARFIITPSATLKTSQDVVDSLNTLDRASVVATYAEVMNSQRIITASMDQLKIDALTMEDYIVNAVVLPSSSVLELTVTGPDARVSADLANTIGEKTIQFADSINFIFDMNFLDRALPPVLPISPQPFRDAGLSLLLGAVVGIAFTIASEQIRIPLEAYRQHLRLDSSSGVYIKRHFLRLVEQEMQENPDASMAIGVIELDGLKDMVEALPSMGQQQLLKNITHRLQNELRGNDVIGRWNDYSFSVMLPETPSAAASRTFERIYMALSTPVDLPRYDITIGPGPYIGAAMFSNRITLQELVEKVESSLDQARRSTDVARVYLWDLKNPFWNEVPNA